MPEYIERDLVISKIEERAMLRCHAHDAATYRHLKLVKWDIADLPAADVVPVRHGRWVDFDDDYGVYDCSECGERAPDDCEWNYCPNCGALMDAKK